MKTRGERRSGWNGRSTQQPAIKALGTLEVRCFEPRQALPQTTAWVGKGEGPEKAEKAEPLPQCRCKATEMGKDGLLGREGWGAAADLQREFQSPA